MIFHLHLGFPEIRGPISLTITTIWGKSVVWGHDLIWPDLSKQKKKTRVFFYIDPRSLTWLKMMVGRLFSFWDRLFSGAMIKLPRNMTICVAKQDEYHQQSEGWFVHSHKAYLQYIPIPYPYYIRHASHWVTKNNMFLATCWCRSASSPDTVCFFYGYVWDCSNRVGSPILLLKTHLGKVGLKHLGKV